MKRFDLEEMGLEKEAIDKIMAWNGEDINAEKAKTTRAEGERDTLQTQLNTATETLKGFEGVDVAGLQERITTLTGQLESQQKDFAFSTFPRLCGIILCKQPRCTFAVILPISISNYYLTFVN